MGRRDQIGRHSHRLMFNSKDVDSKSEDCVQNSKGFRSVLIMGLAGKRPKCGKPAEDHSRLALLGAAKFSASCHNGCHDSGISGAAADLTAELVSDRLGIRICHAQQNVPRDHQHARCAKSAL